EAHGAAGDDVQTLAASGRTVEVEHGVRLGEVVVGADLDGPVRGVDHAQRDRDGALVYDDRRLGQEQLPGDDRKTLVHRLVAGAARCLTAAGAGAARLGRGADAGMALGRALVLRLVLVVFAARIIRGVRGLLRRGRRGEVRVVEGVLLHRWRGRRNLGRVLVAHRASFTAPGA